MGRTKRIYSSSPTSRQGRSSPPPIRIHVPQSFGALLLRLGAMIRPTASGRFLRHRHSSYCTTARRVARCIKARRVTLCRDARSERPLYQRLLYQRFNGDGRSDRASLHRVTRHEVCRITVLVEAEYALWADTQVRPYTSYVSTTIPLIKRCNPDLRRDARLVSSGRASVPVKTTML